MRITLLKRVSHGAFQKGAVCGRWVVCGCACLGLSDVSVLPATPLSSPAAVGSLSRIQTNSIGRHPALIQTARRPTADTEFGGPPKASPFEYSMQAAPAVASSALPEPPSRGISVREALEAGCPRTPKAPSTGDSVRTAPTADFRILPEPPSIDRTVQVDPAVGARASPHRSSIGWLVQAASEVDSSVPLTPLSPPSIDGSTGADIAAASSSLFYAPSITGSLKASPETSSFTPPAASTVFGSAQPASMAGTSSLPVPPSINGIAQSAPVAGVWSPPTPPSMDRSAQAGPAAIQAIPTTTPSINQWAKVASTAGMPAFVEGGTVSAARLSDNINTKRFAFVAENFAWDKSMAAAAIVLGGKPWPDPGRATHEGVEGSGEIGAVAGFRHVLSPENAAFESDAAAAAMVVGDADWPAPGGTTGGGFEPHGGMTSVAGFGRLISLDSFAFEADAAAAAVIVGDGNWPELGRPENASPTAEMEVFPSTAFNSSMASPGDAEEEGISPGPMIAASWPEVTAGGVSGFEEGPLSVEGGEPVDAHLEVHTTLQEAMKAAEFTRQLREQEEEENRRTVEKEEAESRWKAMLERRARRDSVIEDRRRWSNRVRAAALGQCREERAVTSSPGALLSKDERRQALKRATMGTRVERMRPRG